jgi:hypothetical protein
VFETILSLYEQYTTLINFIKDIVSFAGIVTLFRYFYNWNYIRKTTQLQQNIEFRKKIESELESYVLEKHGNGCRNIDIRFIYWKNYPSQLDNDAFPHSLNIEYHNNTPLMSSWIDSTGIYFQQDISLSVYVHRCTGIFFIAPKGKQYREFTEYAEKRLITHLPFTNIVNFDFSEIIEYEPVFYTKHKYNKCKKLYSNNYTIREKLGDNISTLELDTRKKISKYSWIRFKAKLILCKLGIC